MILIISNKSDIHCNPVIECLRSRGEDFFRLNTEDIFTRYRIEYVFTDQLDGPALTLRSLDTGKVFYLNELKSVWERRPFTPKYSNPDDVFASAIDEEYDELTRWIRGLCFDKRYVGHHYLDRAYENKLKQLSVAYQLIKVSRLSGSIKIPMSIVTNDISNLFKFIEDSKSLNFAIKPISADSVQLDETYEMPFMSVKVAKADIKNYTQEHLDTAPVFVQPYIEKVCELRVTVVGTTVLACLIDSQILPTGKGREDWRQGYNNMVQRWINTPPSIEKFCIEYLESTGLSFGCFDFIHATDGFYYFLECNPNGQWMWLEDEASIPISNAIADYLAFNNA